MSGPGTTILASSIFGDFVSPDGLASQYQTTPIQFELFGLSNTSYINSILAPTYCNTLAENVYYNGPQLTSNGFTPISTTINPVDGSIIQNSTNSNVLIATATVTNGDDTQQSLSADFSQFLFLNEFNVVWSANAASVSGSPIQIAIFDTKGNTLGTINQDWNTTQPQQVSQKVSSLSQSTEVAANSSVQAYLYADYKVKTFRIFYCVTLAGDVVSTFSQSVNNSAIWQANVSTVQYIGNLPTFVLVTQNITVSYYENPTITFQPMSSISEPS